MPLKRMFFVVLALLVTSKAVAQTDVINVGSKTFTESYVLAEIMAQLLEINDYKVTRRFGFAGTLISFRALRNGEIDVYPEYTGTINEVILESQRTLNLAELSAALAPIELDLLSPLGFNNTYALTVKTSLAEKLQLEKISDLTQYPILRFGLSHEFRDRADGWSGLKDIYALPQSSSGIEHGLAYQALLTDEIDVTDAYSTDAELLHYDLVILQDDLGYFPSYLALPLARQDMNANAKEILTLLTDRIDANIMQSLNAQVIIDGKTFSEVASEFLFEQNLSRTVRSDSRDLWPSLVRNTLTHLKLTGIAVLAACIIGLTLALAVYRSKPLSRILLYTAGLLQTIPSIALLALMIPLAGVGQLPAIIALFLYSLLPITRNAITALTTIDPLIQQVAQALGLSTRQQLRYVYLPLSLPHLLSGIRIAAVVSIGTATLAAFIGAGGLGEPIVTGLALNNTGLILQGALPAALLALLTELTFEGIERGLVPPHLISTQSTS